MRPRIRAFAAAHLPLTAGLAATLLLLVWLGPVLAADSVPSGAQKALAPVTKMIATLVAIAIGLGIAICGAVIVWGGIEKTLAGANADAEHRAQKRITNGVMGLVWMILASVIVGTITAIAVAYGLIEKPF
jgi:small-conductance mechanosensitive channel